MALRPLLVTGLITSALIAACAQSPAPSGVMLRLRTDMEFPEAVQRVGLYIARVEGGRNEVILREEVQTSKTPDGTTTVALPTELAIESERETPATLRVRTVAFGAEDRVLAMREARFRMPEGGVFAVPLALLWMNGDDVERSSGLTTERGALQGSGNGIDAFAELRSGVCGDESTLDDTGACRSIDIDVTAPPDVPKTPDAGESTCCFDVDACFGAARRDDVRPNRRAVVGDIGWFNQDQGVCGLDLGAAGKLALALGPERVRELAANVAIGVRAPREQGATCIDGTDDCFIVLDRNAGIDFGTPSGGDGLWAILPPGVCRKWKNQRLGSRPIVAFPACARKAPGQRICATGEAGCAVSDRGWDDREDTPLPAEAGSCTSLHGVSGLYADEDQVIATTSSGVVLTFATSRFNAEGCLVEPSYVPVTGGSSQVLRIVSAPAAGSTRLGAMAEDGLGWMIYPFQNGHVMTARGFNDDWAVGLLPRADGNYGDADLLFLSKRGAYHPGNQEGSSGQLDVSPPFSFLTNGALGTQGTDFVGGWDEADGGPATMMRVRCATSADCTSDPFSPHDPFRQPVTLLVGHEDEQYVFGREGDALIPSLAVLARGSSPAIAYTVPLAPTHSVGDLTQITQGATAIFATTHDAERSFIHRIDAAGRRADSIVTREAAQVHGLAYVASPDPTSERVGYLYWTEWPFDSGGKPDLGRSQIRRVALRADDRPLETPL